MSKPAEVFHPGEFLQDELHERGLTLCQLSKRSELSQIILGGIIVGAHSIDAHSARGISKALGTSADYWLNLQKAYDERSK